jgi:hypothetical protein
MEFEREFPCPHSIMFYSSSCTPHPSTSPFLETAFPKSLEIREEMTSLNMRINVFDTSLCGHNTAVGKAPVILQALGKANTHKIT